MHATDGSPQIILAADVGGTHARAGLLAARAGTPQPIELLDWKTYECAGWPGLAEILEDFLRAHAARRPQITRCAIAAAGYVRAGEVVAENLHWPIRSDDLRARLRVGHLELVNDFEALAWGTLNLPASSTAPVIDARGGDGPTVVLGPGTGLGCAVLVPQAVGTMVLPTEAGHVALAAGNARESEVLRRLRRGRTHVHAGFALSGPGLLNLYRALADIEGVAATHGQPRDVSAAALAGRDPLARAALSMFCALLGSFAGDLAVLFKADGGVNLAGGILPALRGFLLASDFRTRFLDKGVMSGFVANVPVRLIEHPALAVIGAAIMASRGGGP